VSARLLLRPKGGGAPAELPQRGRLVIGSDAARADYVLEGPGVEAVHCAIGRLKDGGWAIKDLGSEYGTLVNGAPATAARLAAGDVLVLGSRSLVIEDPSAPLGGAAKPAQAPAASHAAEKTEAAPKARTPEPAASRTGSEAPSLPGYAVGRRLGKGATGTVWLARQQSLDREVAIKVLSPRLAADRAFVARFQDEARAAASLNHPNVVHVYDVGEVEGTHYLSMEYMEGGCLETRLKAEGPLPWRKALEVLADGARALDYASSRGLVHRDVKPANLMLGADGRARLADLGLATATEAEAVEEAGGRKLVGTPQFLAPEVIRGGAATPASDLYSLGATLYRLLSGRKAFEGEKAKEVLKSVLQDEPEPLGPRVPGLPAGVADLVMRMMAKDPAQRPASAGVVVQQAEALLAGQAVAGGAAAETDAGGAGRLVVVAVAIAAAAAGGWAAFGGGSEPATPRDAGGNQGRSLEGTQVPGEGTPTNEGAGTKDTAPGPGEQPPSEQAEAPDDDAAERAFEEQASVALRVLESTELPDAERVTALRAFAGEWPGSSAATRALEAAAALEQSLAAAAAVVDPMEAPRAALLDALGAAAQGGLPRIATALEALEGVPGQDLFAQDATFLAGRDKVLQGLFEVAATQARELRSDTARLLEAQDLDGLQARLEAFLALADPPLPVTGEGQGLTDLREATAEARALMGELPALRASQAADQRGGDLGLVAARVTSEGGLWSLLERGDLTGAEALVKTLAGELQTDLMRPAVELLLADLERARAGLERLRAAFSQPGWERRKVIDFRGGRQQDYEVTAVGADGPLVEVDGIPTSLGWAPFLGSVRGMTYLFSKRVDGGWPEAAAQEVDSLVRLAALVESLQVAQLVLADGRPSERRCEALLEPFASLLNDPEFLTDPAALEREHAAARSLAEAFRARMNGDPVHEALHLERLLRDHAASGTVLLLRGAE
jgi:hypothetical protein